MVLTFVIATYADKVFSDRSNEFFRYSFTATECSPTMSKDIQSFGTRFEPRCIVGAELLDQ
jgi:hypothetical protein